MYGQAWVDTVIIWLTKNDLIWSCKCRYSVPSFLPAWSVGIPAGCICINKVIDKGVLLLQCIITKILVKEETQQVRHYHVCSKYEKNEENKGCTGKKNVYNCVYRQNLRGRRVSRANKIVGCDWPLVVHYIALLLCRYTFVLTNLVGAIPAAAIMI